MSWNEINLADREQTRINAHFSRSLTSFSGAEGRWFESSWAHQPLQKNCRDPAMVKVDDQSEPPDVADAQDDFRRTAR